MFVCTWVSQGLSAINIQCMEKEVARVITIWQFFSWQLEESHGIW